jgi:hypothetical protein
MNKAPAGATEKPTADGAKDANCRQKPWREQNGMKPPRESHEQNPDFRFTFVTQK